MKAARNFALATAVAVLLAAIGLIAAGTGKARAAQSSWTGCYVKGFGGVAAINHEADLTLPGAPVAFGIDGLAADDVQLGIGGGCDIAFGQFLIGAMADWAWQDAEFKATASLGGGALTATLPMGNEWSLGLRAGLIADKALFYGLVAYTEAKADPLSLSITGTPGVSWALSDWQGWTFGGGIEVLALPNVTLGIEYRYTQYDAQTIALAPTPLALELDPVEHVVRAQVSYRVSVPGL